MCCESKCAFMDLTCDISQLPLQTKTMMWLFLSEQMAKLRTAENCSVDMRNEMGVFLCCDIIH